MSCPATRLRRSVPTLETIGTLMSLPRHRAVTFNRSSYVAAVLLGIAAIASLNQLVFHQLLQWHHFIDSSDESFAERSEGYLHAGALVLFAIGFFVMLRAHGRPGFRASVAWAGFLVGVGLFQLWDGLVNHKLFHLHEIRYVDHLLGYDLVWHAVSALLLVLGVVLTAVSVRRSRPRE